MTTRGRFVLAPELLEDRTAPATLRIVPLPEGRLPGGITGFGAAGTDPNNPSAQNSELVPASDLIVPFGPRELGLVTAPVYEISNEGILISGPDSERLTPNESLTATLQNVGACRIRIGERSKAGVLAQFERPDATIVSVSPKAQTVTIDVGRKDFLRLYAIPHDLNLVINSSQEFDLTIWQRAAKVASPIDTCTRVVAKRIRQKFFGG